MDGSCFRLGLGIQTMLDELIDQVHDYQTTTVDDQTIVVGIVEPH